MSTLVSDPPFQYYRRDPAVPYIMDNSLRLHPVQMALIQRTQTLENRIMMGSPDSLQLLSNLTRFMGAKRTLDVGVFTGCSAMAVAMALPPEGRVIALDTCEDYINIGRPYWKQAGVDHKIEVRIGAALDSLDTLLTNGEAGSFDFAFVDADKVNYDNYYERLLKLIRPGGLIAFDNVLWAGRVFDPEVTSDPATLALRKLNQKLKLDERINISMLSVGDGITLAFVK